MNGKLNLFADDMSLVLSAKTYSELNVKLNSDLNAIQNWLKINRLILNFDKTNYVIMGSPKEESIIDFKPNINGKELSRAMTKKVLGFHIDNSLKFDVHINKLKKDLNSQYSLFTRLKKYLPKKTLSEIF